MPVYGRGRIHRKKLVHDPDDMQEIKRGGKRRVLSKTEMYGITMSTIENLEQVVGPIREKIRERMKTVERPVVVDWGCGTGTTITQIAEEFQNAKCYGYSKDFFGEWKTNEKVKFIYAPQGELARYFKDNSVDVFYAGHSIQYLPTNAQLTELRGLVKKLKVGGVILVDMLLGETVNELKQLENLKISFDEVQPWDGPFNHKCLIERIK